MGRSLYLSNIHNLLWLCDLGRWEDRTAGLIDKDWKMSPANAGLFLQMLADSESVLEANLKKVKPAKGGTKAKVDKYFHDKYKRLKAFLQEAIDRKEDIQCSI